MSGRGDNNKSGTSGRGASKQSNQGMKQTAGTGKTGKGDQTGSRPSVPQKKEQDQSSSRNTARGKENG